MTGDMIDLRSDVKTLPTDEMLEAMCSAELGDSKAGEDPTVLRLEAMAAERLGMEAAMLVISGTMANLCALMVHTAPGDGYFTDPENHIFYYEGGHVAMAGALPMPVESREGLLAPEEFLSAIRRCPERGRLLCLENPHIRWGGRVIPVELCAELYEIAHEHGMAVHLDGARIFNAVVASGTSAAQYAAHADSVMFCLSKSLSCPLGSLLCGSSAFIQKARKVCGRLGGGMRQAGIIAAAGIVALETMIDRLAQDHALAKRLAQALNDLPGLSVDLETVDTNMVNVNVRESRVSLKGWQQALKGNGVLVSAYSRDRLRLVTHRHHNAAVIEEAIRRIQAAVRTM